MRKLGGYLKPWTAAQYLGIPLEEVEQMLESGELPGIKMGGQWRVPLDQLERWLDEEVPQEELKQLAKRLKDVDPQKIKKFFEEATRESHGTKKQRRKTKDSKRES